MKHVYSNTISNEDILLFIVDPEELTDVGRKRLKNVIIGLQGANMNGEDIIDDDSIFDLFLQYIHEDIDEKEFDALYMRLFYSFETKTYLAFKYFNAYKKSHSENKAPVLKLLKYKK